MWSEGQMQPQKMNSSIAIESPGLFVSAMGDIYINNVYDDSVNESVFNVTNTNDIFKKNDTLFRWDGKFVFDCGLYERIKHDYDKIFDSVFVCYNSDSKECKKYKKDIRKQWKERCDHRDWPKPNCNYWCDGRGKNRDKTYHMKSTDDENNPQEDDITISRVYKLLSNTRNSSLVMTINGSCTSLFIIDSIIYCSISDHHQVVKKSLNSSSEPITIVAGTGANGSTSDTLNYPQGIFVNTNFDLYVADSGNHRIQLFRRNQKNGTTIVGNEKTELWWPTGVAVDGNNTLYIVDNDHRRVFRFTDNLQCILGCDNDTTTTVTTMFYSDSLCFDSHGNIFVSDWENNRILKFCLSTNLCGKCRLLIIESFSGKIKAIMLAAKD